MCLTFHFCFTSDTKPSIFATTVSPRPTLSSPVPLSSQSGVIPFQQPAVSQKEVQWPQLRMSGQFKEHCREMCIAHLHVYIYAVYIYINAWNVHLNHI